MPSVNSQCLVFKVSPSWNVEWLVSERVSGSLTCITVAIAEVSGFILVKPNSIEDKVLVSVKIIKAIAPPFHSRWLEEVREVGVSTPYSSCQVVLFVGLLNEHVIFQSLVKSFVALVFPDGNSSVHNGNEIAIIIMNLLNVCSDVRITHVRDGEEFVVIHVVNVSPHSI